MTGWGAGVDSGATYRQPAFAMARCLLVFVVLLFALMGAGAGVAAQAAVPAAQSGDAPAARTDAAIEDVVKRARANAISDGDIQTNFVEPPPPKPRSSSPPPAWLRDLIRWMFGPGNGIVKGLGWLLVGLVVLGALYLTVPWVRDLVDSLLARFRKPKVEDEGDDFEWRPDEGGARNLLAEADRLAAEGRYGEAAHLVLGRSLEDIASRRPGLLKPALTARAIALMTELPAPARAAFGQIAATVERSLWARQEIDLSSWQSARSAYEDFAFGAHWRGSAA